MAVMSDDGGPDTEQIWGGRWIQAEIAAFIENGAPADAWDEDGVVDLNRLRAEGWTFDGCTADPPDQRNALGADDEARRAPSPGYRQVR